jgi:putative hydrolase of the HAD superfamily
MIDAIGFDGDDTLWHNERIFSMTQARLCEILRHVTSGDELDRRLLATERKNLRLFGYGVKGFTLSMIETAIEVSDGRVTAADIQQILDAGKAMLDHPVELLPGVRETLEALGPRYDLWLITKGDLFDQESKLARSGLAPLFDAVEIVSEKDAPAYRRILKRRETAPDQFVMVGNSVKSDILPARAIGAHAVHVHYPLTWAHENVDHRGAEAEGFVEIDRIDALLGVLERLG